MSRARWVSHLSPTRDRVALGAAKSNLRLLPTSGALAQSVREDHKIDFR